MIQGREEFAKTFRENSQYLGMTSGLPSGAESGEGETPTTSPSTGTLAEAGGGSILKAFVILPFVERDLKFRQDYSPRFFAVSLRLPPQKNAVSR